MKIIEHIYCQIKKHLNNLSLHKTVIILLLFNIVIFAFLSRILPIRFETDDDITMLLLASGKYTGTPEAHLVYLNYLLGFLLSTCYKFTSKLEWYTLFFSFIHICSLTVLSVTIIRKKTLRLLKFLFLFLLYAIEVRLILTFQFTTTSAFCALAGLILIDKNTTKYVLFGVILFMVASLIRFQAAILVFILYLPFYITVIFSGDKKQKLLKYTLIGFAMIGSIFLHDLDIQIYKNSTEWSYFLKYNTIRAFITDNPNAYLCSTNLPKSISHEDFSLLMKFLIDAHKFPISIMQELQYKITSIPLIEKLKQVYPSIRIYNHLLFILAILFAIVIYINKEKRYNYILSLLVFVFILFYIPLFGLLKYRVFITASMPMLFLLFLYFKPIKNQLILFMFSFFILLYIIDFSITTISIIKKEKKERILFSEQKQLIDTYLIDPSKYIIPYYDRFSVENLDPFAVSDQMHFYQIVNSGWLTYYPYNKKVFPSFLSFTNNLALFINRGDTTILRKVANNIFANYNIRLKPNIIKQSQNYMIVQFIK